MSGYYSEQISKEVESINENIRLIKEIQKNEFSEALLMLSQGWSGEASEKFTKKSRVIYENLNDIITGLESIAEQISDSATE